MVCNEPSTQSIVQKHPALQVQDPKIEFAEFWDFDDPAGKPPSKPTPISSVLHRHGFLEETHYLAICPYLLPIIGPRIGPHATVVEPTGELREYLERREQVERQEALDRGRLYQKTPFGKRDKIREICHKSHHRLTILEPEWHCTFC
jgi:hypothetical protein